MANFYLISFDPSTIDTTALHKVIANSSSFIAWWHYLGSAYLVKTTSKNLAGVHTEILEKWPNNRFLIIKVDPAIRNGWLPPDAWEWFKKHVD